MRTVHSYALTQFQTLWPELVKDIGGVSGWEYVMLGSYLMECAKRGFLAVSPARYFEIMDALKERYPDVMFEHRRGKFILILNNLGEARLATITKKLREEIVGIAGDMNLVWMGLTYNSIDLVKCRYHLKPINSLRMAL